MRIFDTAHGGFKNVFGAITVDRFTIRKCVELIKDSSGSDVCAVDRFAVHCIMTETAWRFITGIYDSAVYGIIQLCTCHRIFFRSVDIDRIGAVFTRTIDRKRSTERIAVFRFGKLHQR